MTINNGSSDRSVQAIKAELTDLKSMLAASLAINSELVTQVKALIDRQEIPTSSQPPLAEKANNLTGQSLVVPPHPVIADDRWREPPRKPEDRQSGYLEAFDDTTIFYDVFLSDGDLVLSGPPALSALPFLKSATFQVDTLDVTAFAKISDRGRTQRSRILGVPAGQEFRVLVPDAGVDVTVPIGPDYAGVFAGRRTLITMSKNNELGWIREWLTFYQKIHGVDSVLLYDNDSTDYSITELQNALSSVPGVDVAVVVPWPFKYGPGGGPKKVWDSDYCQYSAMEHARWRFLRRAAGVINADIDELLIADDDRTAFDYAAESPVGAVLYGGRWVEKVTAEPLDPDRPRRFVDYYFHRGSGCTAKWTLIPERIPDDAQWRVHSINRLDVPHAPQLMHRHFQGINTNWKYNRAESVADPAKHQRDERLIQLLKRVFGEI